MQATGTCFEWTVVPVVNYSLTFLLPVSHSSHRHHKSDDLHSGALSSSESSINGSFTGISEADAWAQKQKEALAEAKRITEEKGASDPDARIAWELVEELAATASHHATTGSG